VSVVAAVASAKVSGLVRGEPPNGDDHGSTGVRGPGSVPAVVSLLQLQSTQSIKHSILVP
jgi:hypothetical protein